MDSETDQQMDNLMESQTETNGQWDRPADGQSDG